MQDILIGAKYRDIITGFVGTCVGHVNYITGCNQTLLVPQASNDGDLKQGQWFDDQRMERVGTSLVQLDNAATPGACEPAPIK